MPKLKKAPGNLAALTNEVVNLYKGAHQHVVFNIFIDESVPVFFFDAVQIKRVLINLLDNAVAALENTGEITVRLGCDNNKTNVILQVADNGAGIEPAGAVFTMILPLS